MVVFLLSAYRCQLIFTELPMKLTFKSLLIVSALFIFVAQTVMAEDAVVEDSYPQKMGQKLAVGFANIVTGFVELPKTIIITGKEKGAAYGATAGFGTGIVQMLGRTLFGAADLVTFMIPTKPMIYPEYVWNDIDKETTYNLYPRWK